MNFTSRNASFLASRT